jgi:aspartate racemase
MTQHIGIVACSAEGAALCYRTICLGGTAVMGRHMHPQVTMHTQPLGEYYRHIYAGDWDGVARLMLASAEKLARAGADFLVCPDNTIHQAFELVAPQSPLPWLHIAEEVATEAGRKGFRRLGLLGTKFLVQSSVYPSRLAPAGISYVLPTDVEREKLNQIIEDELVYARFTPESLRAFVDAIERMRHEGCDAVVLGCTEIPLLLAPESSPLPTLDSTRLLARAALRRAVATPSRAKAAQE